MVVVWSVLRSGFFVGLSVVLFGIAALPSRALDDDAAVKFRKNLMREVQASVESLSLLLKGEVGDEPSVAAQARILSLAVSRAEAAFVSETLGLVEPTKAREKIWRDWKDFQTRMRAFHKDARELPRALSDRELFAEQFGRVVSHCKSCHKRYRKR